MTPASNAGFFTCGHSPLFFAVRVQRVNAVCQLRSSLLTFSFYYTFPLPEYLIVPPIYLHPADALYTPQFGSHFSSRYQHNILCTKILDFDICISIRRIAHTALVYFFLSSIPWRMIPPSSAEFPGTDERDLDKPLPLWFLLLSTHTTVSGFSLLRPSSLHKIFFFNTLAQTQCDICNSILNAINCLCH